MDQPPLFVENINDALKAIVDHVGGPKVVGAIFWPAKSVVDAAKLLRDCLNPERNEKLEAEQIVLLLRMGREAGFHVAKHWLDAETGYQPSLPANPADEEARQVAIIETAGVTLTRALTALDKLRERKPLAKVA